MKTYKINDKYVRAKNSIEAVKMVRINDGLDSTIDKLIKLEREIMTTTKILVLNSSSDIHDVGKEVYEDANDCILKLEELRRKNIKDM